MKGWNSKEDWWVKRLWMARLKAKSRCEKTGLPFELESSDLIAVYLENGGCCSLSGLPFRQTTNYGLADIMSISVDRIRPELGYVKGNVRLILHGLNALKGMGTDEEVMDICRAVASRG